MSITLTEQEIEAVKGFQQQTNAIIGDLGRIAFQIADLEEVKGRVMEAKAKLAADQNEFFKTIESSYGKGQINLDTFEFIPAEEPTPTMEVVQ
jgi:hypothetical protein